MAQRIHLVPIEADLLTLYENVAAADSESEGLQTVEACGEYSRRQQECARAIREVVSTLNEAAFEAAGHLDHYYLLTQLRPYVLTGSEPNEVVDAVVELWSGDSLPSEFFRQQVAKLDPGLITGEERTSPDDDDHVWQSIVEDLLNLRTMREAAEHGKLFSFERQVREEWAPGISEITERTETITLAGPRLLESYGHLCGYALARLAGHSGPTWWIGNNYWPGLLLAAELGPAPFLFNRKAWLAMDALAGSAQTATELFDRTTVPGFESGFSLLCAGYSAGLYFPPDGVTRICESIRENLSGWRKLSKLATGYNDSDIDHPFLLLQEGFEYAARQGCGLLEADEAVYR